MPKSPNDSLLPSSAEDDTMYSIVDGKPSNSALHEALMADADLAALKVVMANSRRRAIANGMSAEDAALFFPDPPAEGG